MLKRRPALATLPGARAAAPRDLKRDSLCEAKNPLVYPDMPPRNGLKGTLSDRLHAVARRSIGRPRQLEW